MQYKGGFPDNVDARKKDYVTFMKWGKPYRFQFSYKGQFARDFSQKIHLYSPVYKQGLIHKITPPFTNGARVILDDD